MAPRIPRPTNCQTSARAGFSLIELVITMTIMTLLVGVVSMRASSVTDKARAAKIISVVEALRTPVALYLEDTGQFPIEYANRTGANVHRLASDPGIAGWAGPYIEDPLRLSVNPSGGNVNLYNQIPGAYANGNGIDIDGDGNPDVTGTQGSLMVFWQIEAEVAERVDRAFDQGLPGTWSDAGRVEYNAGARRLYVLVGRR